MNHPYSRNDLIRIAKGILFKPEMAYAIRMGRKIQTRRLKDRYRVGDILYVKEPWAFFDENMTSAITKSAFMMLEKQYAPVWKNSLFMPKKYADQFLRVTKISIQHIQDITCDDIHEEGVDCPVHPGFLCENCADLRAEWIRLWNSINKDKGTTYQDNPVVYAYTFKVLKYT